MHPTFIVLFILISPLLLLVWLIDKANEERMLRKVREENERKRVESDRLYLERQKKLAEERAGQERKRASEFAAAERAGIDLCKKCNSIRPRRCKCGNCMENYPCSYGSSKTQCAQCAKLTRERLCREAKFRGEDVCLSCLTVKPNRCYCGNCTNCYGGIWECNSCSD